MSERRGRILTVVVPVYNEERSIPTLVQTCREVDSSGRISFLIVENGSTDGSMEVLLETTDRLEAFEVLRVKENRGFGGGISRGIDAATTDFVAWIPGNLKVDPASCVQGLDLMETSSHFPEVAAKARRKGRPLYDRTATATVSILWTLMTRQILWDTGAPPTIVPRQLVQGKQLPSGYELEVYVTWLIKKSGLPLIRFPVHYGDRKYGRSRWNVSFWSQLKLTWHITNFVRKEMLN